MECWVKKLINLSTFTARFDQFTNIPTFHILFGALPRCVLCSVIFSLFILLFLSTWNRLRIRSYPPQEALKICPSPQPETASFPPTETSCAQISLLHSPTPPAFHRRRALQARGGEARRNGRDRPGRGQRAHKRASTI